jgi:hypothetical protein
MSGRYSKMLKENLRLRNQVSFKVPTAFTATSTKKTLKTVKTVPTLKSMQNINRPISEVAWLDNDGRLRIKGPAPDHLSRLELLICLRVSAEEIVQHIDPIGTPNMWREWTGLTNPLIRYSGELNHVIR